MNEIGIKFNLESPQAKDTAVEISVDSAPEERLLYKFFVGNDGVWETLKDFSYSSNAFWVPKNEGPYIIMVQGKREGSSRPFDYISKAEYNVGGTVSKIINNVTLDKYKLKVGEKLNITVSSDKQPVVYKYWTKEKEKWELIKDYCAENSLTFTVKASGEQEILVEAKALDSKNNYDDFQKVQFEVLDIEKLEIKDFHCLTGDLLVDNELVFQVDAQYEDSRMILYKFLKINEEGIITCIQDYSTKRMVSFTEKDAGKYRLLCMAKDMYSPKDYDDRAIINYEVKLYKPVVIQSFTTDIGSPQIVESSIELKAVVKGGRNLLYRFIIDGEVSEDSGYIKDNEYVWKAHRAGNYNIKLWVKDASCDEKLEDSAELDYVIDELSKNVIKIQEIILDRNKGYVKGETVNVKAIATGGVNLRYSFHVYKDKQELERVEYGSCSWVNFTPEEEGNYELEVRVKDKYSQKDFDSHEIIHFSVLEFLPAEIDYVLLPSKEHYMVGDTIGFEAVTRNTRNTQIKYVLKINGHKTEETAYVDSKKYTFTPKCSGSYVVELFARNEKSTKEFDVMKEVKIYVNDAPPVTNTKVQCDRTKIVLNEPAIFSVRADGGRDVVYEFYLMVQGEWDMVQRYSKKNYYSFIPFDEGKFKILALCKSAYKECAYEDYDIMEFTVE